MPDKQDNSSIKNPDQYEALREKGASKEKAARIANTASDDIDHDSRPYEERSVEELYEQAKQLDIDGRSDMNKEQLIEALRNH